MRSLAIVVLLALASGCASWPQDGTVEAGSVAAPPESPATPAPAAGPPPATTRPYPGSAEPVPVEPPAYHPAGEALIAQARDQARAGETGAAGATLERALRVDPDNPWIWIELSRVRYAEGDPAGGQGMARKALSLAGRDASAAAAARRLMSGAGP